MDYEKQEDDFVVLFPPKPTKKELNLKKIEEFCTKNLISINFEITQEIIDDIERKKAQYEAAKQEAIPILKGLEISLASAKRAKDLTKMRKLYSQRGRTRASLASKKRIIKKEHKMAIYQELVAQNEHFIKALPLEKLEIFFVMLTNESCAKGSIKNFYDELFDKKNMSSEQVPFYSDEFVFYLENRISNLEDIQKYFAELFKTFFAKDKEDQEEENQSPTM